MLLQIKPDTVDEWLKDEGSFRYDFLRAQNFLCQAVGYHFDPDFAELRKAHAAWNQSCLEWQNGRMADPAKPLSLLKVLALLLHALCDAKWMKELKEFDETNAPAAFAGTEEEKEEVRKDIAAGRETYLALQFVMIIINWFERARTDRIQPFEFRMTLDLDHDIMVYLTSGKKEPVAIYLILKALYARDPTPDAPSN